LSNFEVIVKHTKGEGKKPVSYECVSYSIQEGAFFLVSGENGRDGFFIPLNTIQEVQIIDNRTDEDKALELEALREQKTT